MAKMSDGRAMAWLAEQVAILHEDESLTRGTPRHNSPRGEQ